MLYTGSVKEIGLFVTALDMADNVPIYAGNNKLFSDIICSCSNNPYRRVDLKAQIAHSVNPNVAVRPQSAPSTQRNPPVV